MCDACERPPLSRRRLLARALTGGAAMATSPLWLPGSGTVLAGDGDVASMGEDANAASNDVRRSKNLAPAGIAATRSIPAVNPNAIQAPPIVTRKGWGADESIRIAHRTYAPIRKLVVHHTASPNRPGNPASVVRSIYQSHVKDRGFADIGYNYMIDHQGVIYEGRYSRRFGDEAITGEDQNGWGVVGAHAQTMNAGTCGVCLIGNFMETRPTDAALTSLQWLLAWKASRHRIDVLDTDPYVNTYGHWATFANLGGHRDVGQTYCPGTKMYGLMATLRQNVAGQAGRWDPLIADIPRIVRSDWTINGQAPGSTSTNTAGTMTTTAPPAVDPAAAPTTTAPTTTAPTTTASTGTTVAGYRAITTGGSVFTAGSVGKYGQPGSAAGAITSIANPGFGDSYLSLTAAGKVSAFGGLTTYGDIAGKGDGTAIDIVATPSGAGYWILVDNGGIYPFGDARYFNSPKRKGIVAKAVAMAARPQGDGYWTLHEDGTVQGFGSAAAPGGPGLTDGPMAGIASTSSGKGYWVLMQSGNVAAFGDAPAKGGIPSKNVKWNKPATAIMNVPGTAGYVISARDGGLYTFNGAPYFGSFAGSGATVSGLTIAAR